MMKVTMNKCEYCGELFTDDTTGFDLYLEHFKVHKIAERVEQEFPPPGKLNNDQCIIRRVDWLERFKRRVTEEAERLYPECRGSNLGFYFRRINEHNPFRTIVFRLASICKHCGREWNQPWGAINCTHLARDAAIAKANGKDTDE